MGRGGGVLGSGDGEGGDFCGRYCTVDKNVYICSFGVRTKVLSVRSDCFLERNLKQLEFEEEITAHSFVGYIV